MIYRIVIFLTNILYRFRGIIAIGLVAVGIIAAINIFGESCKKPDPTDDVINDLLEVYPGGSSFAEMDLSAYAMPDSVVAAYTEASGGYVFRVSSKGKSEGMIVMCGIDADGHIVGVKCIENAETPTYFAIVIDAIEKTGYYVGKDIDSVKDTVYTVSGATLSSKGYHQAVKDALLAFAIAGGASVDMRPIEQIKSNEALGTEDLVFEKAFVYEVLEGVSAVYTSSVGNVYVIDGSYVGVKDSAVVGTSLAEGAETVDETVALSADAILQAATLTDVEKPAGVSKNVLSIKVSGSGNYVIEVKALGYSLGNDHYVAPDAEPIIIRVAIDSEGRIISTLTVSHKETNGYGAVCGTPEYYEQYNGKTAETYDEVGAISGATYTSTDYKKAIKNAFIAFEILTGGEAA